VRRGEHLHAGSWRGQIRARGCNRRSVGRPRATPSCGKTVTMEPRVKALRIRRTEASQIASNWARVS
jgi:hypothetical protein